MTKQNWKLFALLIIWGAIVGIFIAFPDIWTLLGLIPTFWLSKIIITGKS